MWEGFLLAAREGTGDRDGVSGVPGHVGVSGPCSPGMVGDVIPTVLNRHMVFPARQPLLTALPALPPPIISNFRVKPH